jgi:IS30 family transposase
MDRQGKHLDCAERAVVFSEDQRGSSQRQIARLLGRAASTICRELARGRPEGGAEPDYCPQRGQQVYDQRRLACRPKRKLLRGGASYLFVCRHLLDFRWSPEQIAATLRRMHPDDPSARVSHETIYAMIYAQPRGGLKAAMTEALRQGKTRRGIRRRTCAGSAIVPESLKIIHRPEEVDARLIPGHWEGDMIKGAGNRTSVGTLVERKTRFLILSKMNGNGAEAALEGFSRQMKRLPASLRKSMTYDRGLEMACHPELARRLKIDIWFCDPHTPWQRGSNENTNGLLRQFLPKGSDLSQYSQRDLSHIARLLNNRPRKTLGWKTPAEAFAEELAKFTQTVGLGP